MDVECPDKAHEGDHDIDKHLREAMTNGWRSPYHWQTLERGHYKRIREALTKEEPPRGNGADHDNGSK